MRVLITGGTGHIGKTTAEHLLQKGWDVRIFDVTEKTHIADAEFIQGNILDYDNLLKYIKGCDAVIHLAALAAPSIAPGSKVFEINVTGTFNVFEAAAVCGIGKVAQASSINALGAYFSVGQIYPQYFPIDEEHPQFTTDPYSFSKQLIEEIGDYYWRRDSISSVALRFPGVYAPEGRTTERYYHDRTALKELLDELVRQPQAERETRLNEVKKRVMDFRKERAFEFRLPEKTPIKLPYDDLLFRLYMRYRFDLWAFVDVRDAAQSLEKGITADYQGSHPLFINATHNALGYDSRTLVHLFYPEVTQFKSELTDSASLVSIQKARSLIGFEPEYNS
ncbi:MAG: NAD-dependent epimerase/dehydratase family protein [Anaerolineaceae bacterium]|nr:NAD-dependent epimerase/dehydratase family protein [Anaerolineaceae bacterium]